MATGGSQEIKSAGDYIEEHIQAQKDIVDEEFVRLDFEPNTFKESFAPVSIQRDLNGTGLDGDINDDPFPQNDNDLGDVDDINDNDA